MICTKDHPLSPKNLKGGESISAQPFQNTLKGTKYIMSKNKKSQDENSTTGPSQDEYSKWGKCPDCGNNYHFSRFRKSGSIELKCPKCNKWASINKQEKRKPRKPYVHPKVNAPCECASKPRKSGFYKGQQRLRCPECGRTWYDLSNELPPSE